MRTLSVAVLGALFFGACGGGGGDDGGDDESFATYQDCFDDHHGGENLSVEDAITICCASHPIGGAAAGVVCGATAAACEDYVDASLDPADATGDDITAGCAAYIEAIN